MIPFKDRVARAETFIHETRLHHTVSPGNYRETAMTLALAAEFVAQELPQMERRVGDAERRKAAFDAAVPDFDPATNVSAREPELPGWLPPDHFFAAPAAPLRHNDVSRILRDKIGYCVNLSTAGLEMAIFDASTEIVAKASGR